MPDTDELYLAVQREKKLVKIASGRLEADLVLKNANVFAGFFGGFERGDIAIADGRIAGIGSYSGKEEIDLDGMFVTPGFIDAQVHIECSMLTPERYAELVVPCGTTTIVADPHEIANIAGNDGIQYILEATENLPLNVYLMMPSCVPSSDMETSGAKLLAGDLQHLSMNPRVLGLAEMMNAPGVLAGDPDVYDKLMMAKERNMPIDGHAPGLYGKALAGYAAGGIESDHECVTADEARARLACGMHLVLRETSAAHSLEKLLPAVNEHNAQFCFFSADDRQPADILSDGDINYVVRKAIMLGMPVATAIQMATINAAKYFGLRDLGAIAPGWKADLVVFDNLIDWVPKLVIKDGSIVANDGKMAAGIEYAKPSGNICHTVSAAPVKKEDLAVPVPSGYAHVIGLVPHQIFTRHLRLNVKTKNGMAIADTDSDILKLAVVERHHASGNVAAALVKGYGLSHGAIGLTIAHDSHNMIIIGTNDDDMLAAAEELSEIQGGVVITDGGDVKAELALPVAGLMSPHSAEEVASDIRQINRIAHEMGVSYAYDPIFSLTFLSLVVMPELKLSDKGLIDFSLSVIPVNAE